MQAKQLIKEQIDDALTRYHDYKRGKDVGQPHSVYLQTLEPAIEQYRDSLPQPEQDAVDFHLDGWTPIRLLRYCKMKQPEVTMNDLRIWIEGNNERYGLSSIMFAAFMKDAQECPFCHDKKRVGNQSIMPKLTGNVCPHTEMWEDQRNKEEGGG